MQYIEKLDKIFTFEFQNSKNISNKIQQSDKSSKNIVDMANTKISTINAIIIANDKYMLCVDKLCDIFANRKKYTNSDVFNYAINYMHETPDDFQVALILYNNIISYFVWRQLMLQNQINISQVIEYIE
jgi:hypothetical protein